MQQAAMDYSRLLQNAGINKIPRDCLLDLIKITQTNWEPVIKKAMKVMEAK